MNTRTVVSVFALAAMFAMTGCATTNKKTELDIAHERNQELAGRLNRAYADLESAMRERDAFSNRLASALQDVNALRSELANQPEPITAPAGWTAVPGGAMIAIESGVLFAPGKAEIRPEARKTLDGIVSTLQGEYGEKDILVFGHTDDNPIKKSGWKDNWQLSSERALAVTRYLAGRGVTPARLAACGAGEFRPKVPNNSEPNRTTNRRVEIFALTAQPGTGRTP